MDAGLHFSRKFDRAANLNSMMATEFSGTRGVVHLVSRLALGDSFTTRTETVEYAHINTLVRYLAAAGVYAVIID
jgi:hypothetical protein